MTTAAAPLWRHKPWSARTLSSSSISSPFVLLLSLMLSLLLSLLSNGASLVQASLVLPAQPVGFNFFVNMTVNHTQAHAIIDSGNGQLTFLNPSLAPNNNTQQAVCLILTEDNTLIDYYIPNNNYYRYSCLEALLPLQLDGGAAVSNITVATNVNISDPTLHPWTSTNADLGLGYCPFDVNCTTPFQDLLVGVYVKNGLQGQNQVFALDFNGPNSTNSTFQLGGVSSAYQSSISWLPQAMDQPLYHEFFLSDLQICGVSLLSNISNNWPVLVDTGSVCLSLPGEVYDTFTTWFNVSTYNGTFGSHPLPALTFTLGESSSETFHIPLDSLVYNNTNLCVIKGDYIDIGASTLRTPNIVFGTLVLQSLYFAADFTAKSVGIASKVPSFNASHVDPAWCAARTICIGDQLYYPQTNACHDPECQNYYFMALDPATMTCVYRASPVVAGMFFIILISLFEILSFFTLQYSSFQAINQFSNFNSDAPKIDFVSVFVGKWCAKIVDYIIINMLQWVVIDQGGVFREGNPPPL